LKLSKQEAEKMNEPDQQAPPSPVLKESHYLEPPKKVVGMPKLNITGLGLSTLLTAEGKT